MVGRLGDVGRRLASSPRLTHLRSGPTGARGRLADQGRAGWFGRAPLEYWFFRTSWAEGALLVHVISASSPRRTLMGVRQLDQL
jgi:hypothetical protein